MFRRISGQVESIRSVAVTSVGGSGSSVSSSTSHDTVFRVAGESLQLKTSRMVNIHAGDHLDVAVIDLLGSPRVVRWHSSTGAKGKVANVWQILVAVVVGFALLFVAAGSRNAFAMSLGLVAFAVAGGVAWLRAGAKRVLS